MARRRHTRGVKASTRWRRLVEGRLAEMERLAPGRGEVGASYWDQRARRYAAAVTVARRDPFVGRVARHAGRRSSVLDVGAGSGRFALALAPRVGEVVAVDPSRGMLGVLRQQARHRGVGNVRTVEGRWEDVDVPPADVAICAFVLPLVADVAPFLAKLDGAARRRVLVHVGAATADGFVDPFWRHFHGAPRQPGPTYLDAVAVLAELGIRADVEVAEVSVASRFPTLAAAARSYADQLLLPDTPAVRRELRELLRPWLVAGRDGLRPPLRTTPAAIVSWRPSRARDTG